MAANLRRCISLIETAEAVENDVARTLRAITARDPGEMAQGQVRLADEAARGAQAAAQRGARLKEQARLCAEHADDVLADLERRKADRQTLLDELPRRLAELRRAAPQAPRRDPPPRNGADAARYAQEAHREWQESVASLAQARQATATALRNIATAHERAARANERSANAGVGDVAEHERMAGMHRSAALAARKRAQQLHDQAGVSEGC